MQRGSLAFLNPHATTPDAFNSLIAASIITGLAQDFLTMFADVWRAFRFDLVAAVDPDRAVDRHQGVVLERHQHVVLDHLRVGRDVVEDADHAEHETIAVETLAPVGEIPCGEDIIEGRDLFQRARMAVCLGGKSGVGNEILAAGDNAPAPAIAAPR